MNLAVSGFWPERTWKIYALASALFSRTSLWQEISRSSFEALSAAMFSIKGQCAWTWTHGQLSCFKIVLMIGPRERSTLLRWPSIASTPHVFQRPTPSDRTSTMSWRCSPTLLASKSQTQYDNRGHVRHELRVRRGDSVAAQRKLGHVCRCPTQCQLPNSREIRWTML